MAWPSDDDDDNGDENDGLDDSGDDNDDDWQPSYSNADTSEKEIWSVTLQTNI